MADLRLIWIYELLEIEKGKKVWLHISLDKSFSELFFLSNETPAYD